MVVRNAHAAGEPGVCFIDRVNEGNPTPHLGRIEGTNPCGEQPLLPFESCNLGSIKLCDFVLKDRTDLCWDSLARTVAIAVRFLDNIVDANCYPVPEIEKATIGNRKIGLGVMGFADMLVLLGVRYDTDEAVQWAKKVAQFVQEHAHQASEDVAKERGSFPNWQGSIWDTNYHKPMRNAAVTTIAPTGSISIIAGCNGGIEPILNLVEHKILDGEGFKYLHPILERIGMEEGWLSERVRCLLSQGIPPKEIPEVPKSRADVVVTAHEISPEWHIKVQAAFQKYTDSSVSKTVNLPSTASIKDVDKVFRLAFDLRCKGTTVFRDHSRESDDQVVYVSGQALFPRPRPRKTTGSTIKIHTGCGTLFVTTNKDENGVCEAFANLGKAGGCPAQSEATCRLISTSLRCGVAPQVLIEQLKGIRCLSAIAARKTDKDIDVLSCPDAIARAIEHAMQENRTSAQIIHTGKCPDCGQSLRREEGCNVCGRCGYSKCG